MNENPGGTPNPLNPSPAQPAPSEPTTGTAAAAPSEPIQDANPSPELNPTTEANQASEAKPAQSAVNEAAKPAEAATQAATPAAQPAPEPAARPAQARPVGTMQDIRPPVSVHVQDSTAANEAAPVDATTPEAAPAQEVRPDFPSNTVNDAQAGAKPKKKKLGLILAIVFFLLALGCAAAALIIINPFSKGDAVSLAVQKFLSGETPKVLSVDGRINAIANDESSALSTLTIDFNAGLSLANNTNTANAKINAAFSDETMLDFEADEVTTTDGDTFIRISGLANALSGPESGGELETTEQTNCEVDANGDTNCAVLEETTAECEGEACGAVEENANSTTGFLGVILGYFQDIDNKWIRVPKPTAEDGTASILDNQTQCLVTAFGDLPKYGNDLKELYKQNPFIEYSTENLKVAKVKNPIYRISINNQKFANFNNGMQTSGFMNSLRACTNDTASEEDVNSFDVNELFASFPTIYVEIDNDYNFTRVYFDADTKNGAAEIKADLNLSYPSSINVVAPEEYVEANQINIPLLNAIYSVTEENEASNQLPPEATPNE